ncbi:MAG: hypothetical protein EXS36_07165 [Pedosphaera sp.]|nr:hypothetical protein [Pedosphaera sp.]
MEFPAGVISVQVLIAPLEDDLVEGDKEVRVQLVEPPIDSLPTYKINLEHARAKIVIHDKPTGSGWDRPVVEILSPKQGERFVNPEQVLFTVRTVDPNGTIAHLDWFDGNGKIGESDIVFIRKPDPGLPLTHEFNWKHPPSG